MKFIPPHPHPPSSKPRHSSLANLFHQGISLTFFFFFFLKKRKKRGLIKLRSTEVHSESIQQYLSCRDAHIMGKDSREKTPPPITCCVLQLGSIGCPLWCPVNVVVKHRMVLHLHRGNARHCLGHMVSPRGANVEFCDS